MRAILAFAGLLAGFPIWAETVTIQPVTVTEWKSVYGTVEARETVPARARIGGVVEKLLVSEGDRVSAGQEIAVVHDDKIAFQIVALEAQIDALKAQLDTAQSDLERGQALVERGVITAQRLDQLQTSVDVLGGQITTVEAQRSISEQQAAEGRVLAPGEGLVLTVPVTLGAVVMPGEPMATIGGGGVFLRLAVPERHAHSLQEGDAIRITALSAASTGRIVKIYPQISNGRVIADVDVEGLETGFVNARVLVELPVGERAALLVPGAAIATRSGLDFIRVESGGGEAERVVVLGQTILHDGVEMVEVLSGLVAGDRVVRP